MLNMMIIDDEPVIADGLSYLVEEHYPDVIRIHRVYTVEAALKHCQRTKLDIVLSDVLMPEMNGLQLQERILSMWEDCQFIFITGHDDFPYVQQALRNGSVSYILKTEGDEVVLAAIDRAIERIGRIYQTESILQEAAAYRQESLPLLRNQLFLRWLRGDWGSDEETAEEMKALQFSLDPFQNVLPVLVQFASSRQHGTAQGIEPFLVMRSVSQTLLGHISQMDFTIGIRWQLYLFQGEAGFERKVLGSLESLQELFLQQTGQSAAIIASRTAEPWKNLSHVFYSMERVARQNTGNDYVQLLDAESSADTLADEKHLLEEMRMALTERCRKTFFDCFDKLHDYLSKAQDDEACHRRVSHTLQMIAMASEACAEIDQVTPPDPALCLKIVNELILQPDTWSKCSHQLRTLFEQLFAVMQEENDLRSHQLISRLHLFISEHLSEELSLMRLGEVVGYNASYLSSVYKKTTGQSLVDYVNQVRLERACQLLEDPALRIRQVALECGFESQQYFNRSFKKKWGLTPNEYRSKKLNLQL